MALSNSDDPLGVVLVLLRVHNREGRDVVERLLRCLLVADHVGLVVERLAGRLLLVLSVAACRRASPKDILVEPLLGLVLEGPLEDPPHPRVDQLLVYVLRFVPA